MTDQERIEKLETEIAELKYTIQMLQQMMPPPMPVYGPIREPMPVMPELNKFVVTCETPRNTDGWTI